MGNAARGRRPAATSLGQIRVEIIGTDLPAKFRLFEMDTAMLLDALRTGQRLVGRVGLTDEQGWPRCATVGPPAVAWSLEA